MGYQILNENIRINKNKNIGKVLYIVEGEKREINIIAKIFLNILEYEEVASINRNGKRAYRAFSNKLNPNSQIVIINSETSNVKTIKNTDFIDKQINLLKLHGLDYDYRNSAIYYIFDADRKEDWDDIKYLINNYTNSREPNKNNEYDAIGGMLLLNYPAIETFIISNFENKMKDFYNRFNFEKQTLKSYINEKKYIDSKLSIQTIQNAFNEMVLSMKNISINEIDLDNVSEFNNKIFEYEKSKNMEYMLSLLLVSFLDLGIIEIENDYLTK